MDFSSLCSGCRTYRRFKQTPIPEKDLQEIMENVRIISSAMNGQILRYVLVKNPELVRLIQPYFHFAGALPPELGEPKKGERPVAFIIVYQEGVKNPWADIVQVSPQEILRLMLIRGESAVALWGMYNLHKSGNSWTFPKYGFPKLPLLSVIPITPAQSSICRKAVMSAIIWMKKSNITYRKENWKIF